MELMKFFFKVKDRFLLDDASLRLKIESHILKLLFSIYEEANLLREIPPNFCPDDDEELHTLEDNTLECFECGKQYVQGEYIEKKGYQILKEARLKDKTLTNQRDEIFVSYNHVDKWWLKELKKFLAPVQDKIEIWDDTRIQAGQLWKNEIEKALKRAKIGVLLVSPDFFNSKFIRENELPPLLDAAKELGTKITWIALSTSMYEHSPIAEYQALNDPSKPLDKLSKAKRNEELTLIGKELYRLYRL